MSGPTVAGNATGTQAPTEVAASPSNTLAFIAGYLEQAMNPAFLARDGRYLTKAQIERLIARANAALAAWTCYEVLVGEVPPAPEVAKPAPFDGTYRFPEQP